MDLGVDKFFGCALSDKKSMSHYISASHEDRGITFVQIGAFNAKKADLFYHMLEANQFHGGTSGLGGFKEYSKKEIESFLLQIEIIDKVKIEAEILSQNQRIDEERTKFLEHIRQAYDLESVQSCTDFDENLQLLKGFLGQIYEFMESKGASNVTITFI